MGINFIRGDVTLGNEEVMAHGCNCRGAFGSGVAAAVKNKWPEVVKEYKEFVSVEKLGQIQQVLTESGKIIVNMFTQLNYGRSGIFVDYGAIENCFKLLREWAEWEGVKAIGIPMIGAGLAGGDWKKIEEIIKKTWKDSSIELNIYHLKTI